MSETWSPWRQLPPWWKQFVFLSAWRNDHQSLIYFLPQLRAEWCVIIIINLQAAHNNVIRGVGLWTTRWGESSGMTACGSILMMSISRWWQMIAARQGGRGAFRYRLQSDIRWDLIQTNVLQLLLWTKRDVLSDCNWLGLLYLLFLMQHDCASRKIMEHQCVKQGHFCTSHQTLLVLLH